MRRSLYVLLILALMVPLAIPFASVVAQDEAVLARLEAYNASLPPAYGNVSVDDLAVEMIENPSLTVVDVRQPDEYEAGHLPEAFNIPLRDLAKNLDLLPDLDAEIVVYCGSGFRSAIAMTALQILGYTDVRNMKGGFGAWNAEEYAVTLDPVLAEAVEAPEIDRAVWDAVDSGLAAIPAGWGAVSAENLNVEMIENPPDLLIDVRTPAEWEQGYIAGAVSMPLESFMSFAGDLPGDLESSIVVYCAGGHRGNMAATMLRTMGFTNVHNMSGGFTAWATAGLPVEGGEAAMAEAFDLAGLLDAYITNLPSNFNAIRAGDVNVALAEDPSILLVDVRTVDEYLGGHLEGAINIPLIELTDHLDMLPNLDQKMIVYCGSGHRSAMAMVVLNLLGYNNALSMLGGVKAWTTAELPVTTEDTAYEAGAAPEFDPVLLDLLDAYVNAIPAGYYAISASNLSIALAENPPVLIDVRTDGEVADGFIEGAIHIELRNFMSQMDQWPANISEPIVLYCGSDHRAVISLVAMQLMGYENVQSLAGGLQAWIAAEYPVVTE